MEKKVTERELKKILNSKKKRYIVVNKDGSLRTVSKKPKVNISISDMERNMDMYKVLPNGIIEVKQGGNNGKGN
jgi:hypothetical protein